MANAFRAVREYICSNLFVVVYMAYIFQVTKFVKLIRHLLRLATNIKELNKVMNICDDFVILPLSWSHGFNINLVKINNL